MIKVENITKSFGDLKVLKGINMKVKRGEILSITTQRSRKDHPASNNRLIGQA